MLETSSLEEDTNSNLPYIFLKPSSNISSELNERVDAPRYLVSMYKGIGDAVAVGLSAVDQIVRHEAGAYGAIDVLATSVQAELFEHDPRINRIIVADKSLFPSPEVTMWLKGIILDSRTAGLMRFLRERGYAGIFPGMFAPGLYFRLRTPMMNPSLLELVKKLFAVRGQVDVPMSNIARSMVSRYFCGNPKSHREAEGHARIPLCLSAAEVRNAAAVARNIKERAGVSLNSGKLLVIAADTASIVTRPPTALLVSAIAAALRRYPDLVVCILQGLTDPGAGENLLHSLSGDFDGRVFMVPVEPRARLLDVAAFIDQADIFVTGDTGLMHIAVTEKRLREEANADLLPRNSVKIIALFGGTNPHLFGYSEQTTILGRGRKEQLTLVPGIFKESYDPKGQDMFDHISPERLTEAIIG